MKRRAIIVLLALAVPLAGCGQKSGSGSSANAPPPASGPPASGPAPADSGAAVSKYDEGPRAGEAPVNAGLATQGEALFKSKGCVACHGFRKKITCPDLAPVAMQRTALWMENQVLHPEKMTKEDPIARELMKQFKLQMPNQGLTPDQARAVIEFIKRQGRTAAKPS